LWLKQDAEQVGPPVGSTQPEGMGGTEAGVAVETKGEMDGYTDGWEYDETNNGSMVRLTDVL